MDDIIDMVQAFMDNCTPRCFYYYYLNFFLKKDEDVYPSKRWTKKQ